MAVEKFLEDLLVDMDVVDEAPGPLGGLGRLHVLFVDQNGQGNALVAESEI